MSDTRCCLTCEFWFVKTRGALTTQTRGECLCMGSHREDTTADDVCGLWQDEALSPLAKLPPAA